ncbi:MAG: hypothetical protein FWE92_04655 [Defluviitaleaceae bacterium]|nr:hypothetical protein [Defluviitaleaceae bacterium]
MQIIYSKQAAKAIGNINNPFKKKIKEATFMPEDEPMPDEIESIRRGREEIQRGETVNHDDIDWD